jgi:hypothetical protein
MRLAPSVGWVFSPLDEELGLLPGEYTPHLHECLVRLSAWMPFEEAVKTVAGILRVRVSISKAVRATEAAGAVYVTMQNEEVTELERKAPSAPAGAEQMVFSGDGVMVPVLHGEWKEVRTLVIGEVSATSTGEVRTQAQSYFSRLASAEEFTRLALVETHRRGVENSRRVGAVVDGAEWLQGFIDHHAPKAVRILDFAHAAEHIAAIACLLPHETSDAAQEWLTTRLHTLKHEGPDKLLAELRQLQTQQPDNQLLADHLTYLAKRKEQMRYPEFIQQGWPIGSGIVESANKLVVEARLKGAGMHWQPANVNPMLALRNILCSNRWDEAWPQIEQRLHCLTTRKRYQQCQQRFQSRCAKAIAAKLANTPTPATLPPSPLPPNAPSDLQPQDPTLSSLPAQPRKPHRPPSDHPWRRSPIGSARYRSPQSAKS